MMVFHFLCSEAVTVNLEGPPPPPRSHHCLEMVKDALGLVPCTPARAEPHPCPRTRGGVGIHLPSPPQAGHRMTSRKTQGPPNYSNRQPSAYSPWLPATSHGNHRNSSCHAPLSLCPLPDPSWWPPWCSVPWLAGPWGRMALR